MRALRLRDVDHDHGEARSRERTRERRRHARVCDSAWCRRASHGRSARGRRRGLGERGGARSIHPRRQRCGTRRHGGRSARARRWAHRGLFGALRGRRARHAALLRRSRRRGTRHGNLGRVGRCLGGPRRCSVEGAFALRDVDHDYGEGRRRRPQEPSNPINEPLPSACVGSARVPYAARRPARGRLAARVRRRAPPG